MPEPVDTSPTARLREMVRDEIRRSGLGERRFEERAGLPRWSLRGFLDPERKQTPSLDRAAEIARALGLELRLAGPMQGLSEAGPQDDLGRTEALRAGFLPVPYHPKSGRHGVAPLAFQRTWLEGTGVPPEQLAAVAVATGGPVPAPPGAEALAVIDTGARPGTGVGLWVYREAGANYIGALQWLDGDYLLVHPASEGAVRALRGTDRATILPLGRVLWLFSQPASPG